MFQFGNEVFFLVPEPIDYRNTEFKVFDSQGRFLGYSYQVIGSYTNIPASRYDEFYEALGKEAALLEAKLKFLAEFKLPIEQASHLTEKLMLPVNELKSLIYETMASKWNLSSPELNDLLQVFS